MIEAKLYQLKISTSFLDYVHNMGQVIQEIHIPSKKLCFNFVDNNVHVFEFHKDRYKKAKKIKNINLSENIVDGLLKYYQIKKDIEENVIKIFNEGKYK